MFDAGADNIEAALCFYRALKVYPNPRELINIYDKTVPKVSPIASPTTLVVLIDAARPGHPRRNDCSRYIHPRRRQQDALRGWVRRRPGVNPPSSSHVASDLAFRHFTLQGGFARIHTQTPLMASDSHCNIFVYVKGLDAFFDRAGRASGRRSGFRNGQFRWAVARGSERAQHRAAM